MKKVKILIITPTRYPVRSGNATDVKRIEESFRKEKNIIKEVVVFTPKEAKDYFQTNNNCNNFDLIHIFHAYKSRIGYEFSSKFNIPLIVTLTGTDFNVDIYDEKKKKTIKDVLNHASWITSLNDSFRKVNFFEKYKEKISIIKRGKPIFDKSSFDFRKKYGFNNSDFIFAFIGGIRSIKDPLCALESMNNMVKNKNDIKLVFIGSILNKKYYKKLEKEIKKYSWAEYLGEIDYENIENTINSLDIIINCSESESESNVLFEALKVGKPIIAKDIEGNRVLIDHMINGLIFKEKDDFKRYAMMLYKNKELRDKISVEAKKKYMNIVNKDEIKEYIETYKKSIKQQQG